MNERIKFWLVKAFEDWRVLVHEMDLEEEEISTSAVCFHAQQFVEKILKAFLTFKNIPFPATHDLRFLLNLAERSDPDFSKIESAGDLTRYAVKVRYPDDFFVPSIDEAKKAFQLTLMVKEFLLQKMNVNEREILEWIKEAKEK